MPHQKGIKSVAQNRKAWHDYFVEEKYECGLALFGTEVKSIRQGRVNLKESWAQIRGGEIWVEGMHISPYDQGNIFNRDPMRPKKLLMHKSEIRKLDGLVSRQGYTLVPLEIYLKDGRMKLQLGLCRGKAEHDKRDTIAKRDADAIAKAVRAVNDSKLEKTVSDAERLLKDSDGKVADAATRDELSKAVKARDADKIAAASKKVNDSVTAKTKADEEAQRKAEEEAAAQAAAQAQTQMQQSYSAPQQSYTPSYSGGSTSVGGSGSSVPDFVPSSGGYGCTDDCPPPSSDGLIHH